MKAIAVCSGKGGAGKTVFSSALGTMLAELGYKVLLVDADYSVAGLTYLTRKTGARVKDFTFGTIVAEGPYEEHLSGHSGVPGKKIVVIPAAPYNNPVTATTVAAASLAKIQGTYCGLLTNAQEFDYVITDTRAGIDTVSAGIALSSDIVIVLMEQDQVSFNSSNAFVANVLALGQTKGIVNRAGAENFYFVPNKVAPAYADELRRMDNKIIRNVLPGIPFDVNFFNRYFRDIFNYQPEARFWSRTAFYRHLRNSMSVVIDELPKVRYSLYHELVDTARLILFALSPRVTAFLFMILLYVVALYFYAALLVGR